MAVCRAKLKFKGDLNADLKQVLKRNGFVYFESHPDWVRYIKFIADNPIKPADFRSLNEAKQAELNRRCNRVIDQFKGDLEKNRFSIRLRISNIAKTLDPTERAWMEDWIKRVIDEEVEVH